MVLTIQQKSTQSSQLFILGLCLTFRLFNAYLTRTYDNPDEYWQGQEVAHSLVFGYGYLTWEWRERIRSFAHPLTIAVIYKLVQLFGLNNILMDAPKYFQAILSAFADFATYSLAKRIFGNDIAFPMLFTTLSSWFNFFMAARTLSNSMEMVFTIIALNFWPLPGVRTDKTWLMNYRISLVLALIACVMRPTNGLIWLFLGIHLILTATKHHRTQIIFNAAIACFIVVMANAIIDTRLYEHSWNTKLIFTPLLFFKINVVNSISLFYGIHTWHWYLSQGIPIILTTFLPLLVYGLYRIYINKIIYSRIQSLLYLSIWVIIIYSLLPHKEFRFIFPIVPILLMVSAFGLQQLTLSKRIIILFLMVTQFPLALYLSLWHQRGVMDVMFWLSQSNTTSVGVLMPCHSTPWYSVMHKDIPMWFLTCEPPLQQEQHYLDEADQFYLDPVAFIKMDDRIGSITSHLVLFDNLLPQVQDILTEQGYTECKRFFNSHFHDDSRRRGDVVVLCHS